MVESNFPFYQDRAESKKFQVKLKSFTVIILLLKVFPVDSTEAKRQSSSECSQQCRDPEP